MKSQISVFTASPGDLTNERSLFKQAIQLLNMDFGDGAGELAESWTKPKECIKGFNHQRNIR